MCPLSSRLFPHWTRVAAAAFPWLSGTLLTTPLLPHLRLEIAEVMETQIHAAVSDHHDQHERRDDCQDAPAPAPQGLDGEHRQQAVQNDGRGRMATREAIAGRVNQGVRELGA